MSDRISYIEDELKNVLLTIDESTVGSYTYINEVKSVYFEQEDEVVSITKSTKSGYPTILISLQPNEIVLSGEAKAYVNELNYILDCKVSLDKPTSNPKQSLKTKMNELAQDIKFCISNNYHINDSCDEAEILYTIRQYNNDGNTLRSGNLKVGLKITYTQSRLNPSINVCK